VLQTLEHQLIGAKLETVSVSVMSVSLSRKSASFRYEHGFSPIDWRCNDMKHPVLGIRTFLPDPESVSGSSSGDVYLPSNCFQKDVLNQFIEKTVMI
jgi:hypothetical protein